MKKIAEKLLDFQNNIEPVKKDATNPHFKKKYATLENIIEAVKPILNAFKLVLLQPIENDRVYTRIVCTETGEQVESSIKLPENIPAQQIGSAITYYRRYTLGSLLALEIEDDDDGNVASQPAADPQKQWLNKYKSKDQKETTETWDAVVKALTSKQYTIDQVEKKYKISKELKGELEIISK